MKDIQLLKINPKDISIVEGFNTRYDLGDTREITASMKAKGFDPSEPLIVRPDGDKAGKYLLGSQGHRRLSVALDLLASKELPDGIVYAVLENDGLTEADRNLDIIRLNSGEPLPMLAAARVVERAWGDGEQITKRDLGRLIGKTDTFVGDCLKLVSTTKQTQKRIEQEKIAPTEVIELVTELKDPEKVEAAVEKLIAKAGDKKATAKTKAKAKEEESETEEEKEKREEDEKIAAEVKVLNKLRMDCGKRAQGHFDKLQEDVSKYADLPEDDKLTSFQQALLDYQVSLASYLTKTPIGTDNLKAIKGDAMTLGDVGQALRAVEKTHKETLKETTAEVKTEAAAKIAEVKTEAKEKVDALKETVKETKEQAAERIKKAKASATPKKD